MDTLRLNTKLIGTLPDVMYIKPAEMQERTSIPRSTWYRIAKAPGTITVQQLISIANGLKIPVRRLFSTGVADIVGRRDDYVAEDYIPCYYDDYVLHDIVSERPDKTWVRAARATGMTRDNLRNSLLAVTRTPVTRFLSVCTAFGIDPFTILVDPNPEPCPKAKGRPAGAPEDFRAEIRSLREDVRRLSLAVDDLTRKYDELLASGGPRTGIVADGRQP